MISKRLFLSLIAEGSFRELFVSELGWNRFRSQAQLPVISVDEVDYSFTAIAERNGFQILTCTVGAIPTHTVCKKIDAKLRRQAHDYIAIYRLGDTQHHLWAVPVKANERRDIVLVEYDSAEKADLLYSKIEGFSFELGEDTTIVDLRAKVQGAFAVNSERITKSFYAGFKNEHSAFVKFITGIDDDIADKTNKNKQWYTSIMLNRLMFCYFIQKKGFLDFDFDYLRHKLEWVRQKQGENRFFSTFYKGFLMVLFHDGLNAPAHDAEFERVYGKIPYLNGGMFDIHFLEDKYPDIDIDDSAFVRLFDFFDTWCWHLDTRITASGKDINPDVLGYIFEQYINDRAQMGAYYTKEDITEYIGRNCIVPFLLDKVREKNPDAFRADGYVWTTLRNSGDRYVFDAVKKGFDKFGDIPSHIRQGIITEQMRHEYCETPVGELPAGHIPLATLRSSWNRPTPEPWALPTEIWRETIERLQRCGSIISKIRGGEITSVNDFITYNLDIRLFAADLLANADRLFVKHFYDALQSVTILDPTCGSGAFLFAAMNILEPLYEACIERMQEQPDYFKKQLAEISHKYRSNIQYFIFKSIILRNLYGVDIMAEATEIAKLRLFLKMAAVVDVDRHQPNLGLDPLPDIDFNIRCGNTLVGYANEEQLSKDLSFAADIIQELANQQFKTEIEQEMSVVAVTFERFKELQLTQDVNLAEFKQAKAELRSRLAKLNRLLNHKLYLSTHISASGGDDVFASPDYAAWKESHQPFHWLAEFYQIIHGNGGFDVIIGNPPYVEYNNSFPYRCTGYKTLQCGNIYAFVLERNTNITKVTGVIGQIVPVSIMSSPGYVSLRRLYVEDGLIYFSSYNIHPCCLFEGAHPRLSIVIKKKRTRERRISVSSYNKWFSDERNTLFHKLEYNPIDANVAIKTITQGLPKFKGVKSSIIYNKMGTNTKIGNYILERNCIGTEFYYRRAFGAFILFYDVKPKMYNEFDVLMSPTELKTVKFDSQYADFVLSVYHSNLYYWFTYTFSDCRNINKPEIESFLLSLNSIETQTKMSLESLSRKLSKELQENSTYLEYSYSTGRRRFQAFYPRKSKPIIDEIDKVLAVHYGFTEEELDFIINYDIKYRMGDALNGEE